MIKVQTLKGFRDFLPAEARKRQYVINQIRKTFEFFDFEPLETPAIEYEEVLLGKYGTEGDKLMYRFTDRGSRKVALRYDQTVPLARVVAQYQYELSNPFMGYQIQTVWRAENTQRGRFREFLQCDADIVGSNSPQSDAQVIMVAAAGLNALKFKNFKILINDRTIFGEFSTEEIIIIDKLKKIGREKAIEELSHSAEISLKQAETKLLSIEDSKPTERLAEIFKILDIFNSRDNRIQYEFSPTLARGLDYYTSTIFEIEIEGYTAGSVCGGGRYDNLIGLFAGRQIPAVGFAYGFDRIMEAIEEIGIQLDIKPQIDVLITIFNEEFKNKSLEITQQLRKKGINVEIYLGEDRAKLEKQLKYADQKQIPYVVIIGPDEAKNNKVTLKNLKSKTQELLSLDEAIQKLL